MSYMASMMTLMDGPKHCNMFLEAVRPATLLKKRLWHRCFPVHFAKFLKTPFL